MNSTTHNLVQGSNEWLAFRESHFGASDAPSMMGASKYRPRTSLVHEKATGECKQISAAQQRLFDRGHKVESIVREAIESELGEELFPVTMSSDIDGLPLSASLDGQTMTGETLFECKLWNQELAEHVRNGELEPHYFWQLEQQLLVSGAERVIFATGDENGQLETLEYHAVPGRAEALIAGWKQFQSDAEEYQPETPKATHEAKHMDALPSLHVEVEGKVLTTNLDRFREDAMAALSSINRELKTDDDFVNAEQAIKDCKQVEGKLSAAKDSVLGQMATVDEVCRTIDDLSAETRRVRLDLDKLVKREKENRKAAIVQHAADAVADHYQDINASLDEHAMDVPAAVRTDIAASIKGLKSLSSITDAADTAAANAKIAASQQADRVRAAVAVLDEFADHKELFADRVQLCATKSPDDLRNLAKTRVADHEKAERERIEAERERIRAEEKAKAQAEQQANSGPSAPTPEQQPPRVTVPDPLPTRPAASEGADDRLIKLGDVQKAIAPLSITAEGLRVLCDIEPADVPGRAKMYRVADVQIALDEMHHLLTRSLAFISEHAKEAA